MTRTEARAALTFALIATTAGLVWLLGPVALVVVGIGIAALVLFVVDVRERDGEVVAESAGPERDDYAGDRPVQPQRLRQ